MKPLSLSFLGPLELVAGSEQALDFRTRKVQALLGYLATEPGAHNRDTLLDLLWPGLPEKSARSNLRQILYYLRQAISEFGDTEVEGVPIIVANRREIQLNPQADVTIDTRTFEALLDKVQTHTHMDLYLCPQCHSDLATAVALYRGDFLADFYLDDSNEFEEWAQARREYFRRRVLDTLEILATIALRGRDFPAAQSLAERQLEIDNLRENAYRQLMEALALSGRREQALAVYNNCRRVLAEELGMAPTTRTSDYYEKILAGDLHFDRFPVQGVRGYELKEEIGSGAYGAIHRAIQPAVMREVAVKVINRKHAADPEFIRRFESEAQTVARLEHPYIVPLYDYWRDPEGAYLVMRYMRGGSLLDKLQDGPWDVRRVAGMLDQVASALSAAHQQGVIHRDIKPGNILLDEAGNSFLADFGIAKNLGNKEPITAEGTVMGTLDYISPEQIIGEPVTPQTDIYSLGAVLYETITGEKPFSDTSLAKLLYSHLNEPVPLVSASQPGISAEIDTVLQKATAKKPGDRFDSILALAAAFRSTIHGGEGVLELQEQESIPALAEIYNPYKGLHAFQETDAEDFFGRDALVQQLVGRLGVTGDKQNNRFLAIVGPSGSGKSSVVKAGLIPALRQNALPGSEKWFITEMVPGKNPLAELESALWRVAVDVPPNLVDPMQRDTRGILRTIQRILPLEKAGPHGNPQLLLIIDQFEELFTLVEDEEQRLFFLDSLLAAIEAPRSPLRVVITLRADFYDRPLQYQDWGPLFKKRTEIMLPLNSTELTWAIREPARRMGVYLEDDLVATIVADVANQSGALPLLQYALTALFAQRQERQISRKAYVQLGGVKGALGQRAEALFASLGSSGQQSARQIFLRLITLGEGVEDTRRRVPLSELDELINPMMEGDLAVADVLDRFGAARFLTFDHDPMTRVPTVEVAHEAMLREWSSLREWLKESREDIRRQRLLANATSQWAAAGNDPSYLLRGSRLVEFESWLQSTTVALTGRENEYVQSSISARDQRQAEEEARRQRELATMQQLAAEQTQRAEEQTRAAQSLRQRALILTGAMVLAAILAVTAFGFARSSTQNANLAMTSEAKALANLSLAATSEAEAIENADLAAAREVEAEQGQKEAVSAQATAQAEANIRATAEGEAVLQRDLAQEQTNLAISRELSQNARLLLDNDPELSMLLALQAIDTAYTKDADEALHDALQLSRARLTLIDEKVDFNSALYTPDGSKIVVYASDETFQLRDAATGKQISSVPIGGNILWQQFKVGSDELLTVTSLGAEGLQLLSWDINTTTVEELLTIEVPIPVFTGAALSPDSTLLAFGNTNNEAELWNTSTGERLFVLTQYSDLAWDYAFSQDGARLFVGGLNAEIELFDIPTSLAAGAPQRIMAFNRAKNGTMFGMSLAPSGELILEFEGTPPLIEIWDVSDLSSPQIVETITDLSAHGFNRDGTYVISRSGPAGDGSVTVWELATGEPVFNLLGHTSLTLTAMFSPNEEMILTSSNDGAVRIWDASLWGGGELQTGYYELGGMDLELSPDERFIANGSWSGAAAILNRETMEVVHLLEGSGLSVYRTSFHPDGSRLATVGEDQVIRIWDVETGDLLLSWVGHEPGGNSGGFFPGDLDVAYSPDGSRLATASSDGTAKVWDADTGEQLLILEGHSVGLHSLDYSPDGSMIATSSDVPENTVRVWDAETGMQIYALSVDNRAWAVTFSPDSRLLATAGGGGFFTLWDMSTGHEIYALPSQLGTIGNVVFTPDGTQFVTSGGGYTRLWDLATGEEIKTIAKTSFFDMDISGDGRFLYGGGPIMVFTLALEDTVYLANERLTRSLSETECQQYLHLDACPAE